MDIKTAIEKNKEAYLEWLSNGRPEAFDLLNDSNIELIKAYKEENPKAKGYKFWKGLKDIVSKIYTFDMEYIFDGNTSCIEELNGEKDEIKKIDILEKYKAIHIIWC